MPIRKSCVPISICFGFFRKHLTLVQQSFRSQRKLFPDPLQYLATRSVHHLADEHGRASTQSAICLLVFVLQEEEGGNACRDVDFRIQWRLAAYVIVVTIKVVTLAVHAAAAFRHFASDAPLLG